MPKYVIESELPGAGQLTQDELHTISQRAVAHYRRLIFRALTFKSAPANPRSIHCYIPLQNDFQGGPRPHLHFISVP